MALYDNGKIRFDDEFIGQFEDELIKNYLEIKRGNLTDSIKSEYCTIENWLYNQDSDEIEREIFWFFLGRKNATVSTFIHDSVVSVVTYDALIKKLRAIEEEMKQENDWD